MPASAKRILIAPLDWGLGHTTRCIPIIRLLQSLGHKILFAGDAGQQAFIRQSLSEIDIHFLEGYRVRYSQRFLMFTLIWQLPRLIRVIRKEHRWLEGIVIQEKIDGIISDNRYGLWLKKRPSIIITHQPGIVTGLGTWVDKLIRRIHYRYLNRFGQIWIPDIPGYENLAGKLSHPKILPARARYIGLLSQFNSEKQKAAGHDGPILILLSGPEPQRTILADKLWTEAHIIQRPIVFVEGKEGVVRKDIPPHIQHISLANAAQLQPLLEKAVLVICRSGYSTLMDLVVLGKKAVLIPTRRQTEQEYLAASLSERGIFNAASQSDIRLKEIIALAEGGSTVGLDSISDNKSDLLMPVLQEWLRML